MSAVTEVVAVVANVVAPHHAHPHPEPEAAPGPSRGAVVLDIGGAIGAAVVVTPLAMDGCEIEVRPVGAGWVGTHVAVRRRLRPGGPEVCAAVFGSLAAGAYELRVRPGMTASAPGGCAGVIHRIEVAGGAVTTTDWPLA